MELRPGLLRFGGVFDLPGGHQLLIAAHFFPIFPVNIQHPKALSLLLAQMFVMHFVRPADGPHISVPASGEPFEALVYDHIMYQEIGETIGHDPKANGLHPPDAVLAAEHDEQHARDREDHEKGIVLLEETGFHLMMVAMQVPEESMHHPFVRSPGDALHSEEGQQQDGDEIDDGHDR